MALAAWRLQRVAAQRVVPGIMGLDLAYRFVAVGAVADVVDLPSRELRIADRRERGAADVANSFRGFGCGAGSQPGA